ncbi:MAG TPA: hypothetical protein VK203_30680 [Nostocaceae cyanobacterium]|nr:hypothetical protein [Nostocaceae cyanobacterium]
MIQERSTDDQKRYEEFLQRLEASRQLQKDWMTYGLDCVDLYFEDVDGNWLEAWGDDEEEENQTDSQK